MSTTNWVELVFVLVLLAISTPLLGSYMAKVYGGERVFLSPVFGPGRIGRVIAEEDVERPEGGEDDPARAELDAGLAAKAHIIPLLCDGVTALPLAAAS